MMMMRRTTIFCDRNHHSPQNRHAELTSTPLRPSYYKKPVKQLQQYMHKLFQISNIQQTRSMYRA